MEVLKTKYKIQLNISKNYASRHSITLIMIFCHLPGAWPEFPEHSCRLLPLFLYPPDTVCSLFPHEWLYKSDNSVYYRWDSQRRSLHLHKHTCTQKIIIQIVTVYQINYWYYLYSSAINSYHPLQSGVLQWKLLGS